MNSKNPRLRRRLTGTVLLAGMGLGAGVGAAGIASAASSTPTTSSTSSTASATAPSTGTPPAGAPAGQPPVGAPNPAAMTHGPGETLLTGTDLTKATAAAQASEPGATIVRAETDSSGDATYEVHMKKADGSFITVELNSAFVVTGTTSGFGPGPAGHNAANGGAPAPGPTPPAGQGTAPAH